MTAMAALTAGVHRSGTADLGPGGPPARTTGPAGADRSAAVSSGTRTVRSWPLLVLAAPAAAEVWSGWVGIAQKTGFGLVSPLPGIRPSLHLDTSITLPVGVEAYAAYALRAWLARATVSGRTRRFAKWSAICSFALGMAGQVAYHLLAQAGAARAPWPVTTSCPACRSWSWPWAPRWPTCCAPTPPPRMGRTRDRRNIAPPVPKSPGPGRTRPASGPAGRFGPNQLNPGAGRTRPGPGWQGAGRQTGLWVRPEPATSPHWDALAAAGNTGRAPRSARPETDQARLMARARLAASGNPVSRRALRSNGVRVSSPELERPGT